MPKAECGVTLIELMIAVAIVAILATIAMPAYQSYRLKAGRGVGAACLLDTQYRIEGYYARTMAVPANLATLGLAAECGDEPHYQRSLTVGAASPCTTKSTPGHYALRATADDDQARDGDLLLCVAPSIVNPNERMEKLHTRPGAPNTLLPGWDFQPGH